MPGIYLKWVNKTLSQKEYGYRNSYSMLENWHIQESIIIFLPKFQWLAPPFFGYYKRHNLVDSSLDYTMYRSLKIIIPLALRKQVICLQVSALVSLTLMSIALTVYLVVVNTRLTHWIKWSLTNMTYQHIKLYWKHHSSNDTVIAWHNRARFSWIKFINHVHADNKQ